jgi:septal ring factor EnvC (AmiA/AmiB activator)
LIKLNDIIHKLQSDIVNRETEYSNKCDQYENEINTVRRTCNGQITEMQQIISCKDVEISQLHSDIEMSNNKCAKLDIELTKHKELISYINQLSAENAAAAAAAATKK